MPDVILPQPNLYHCISTTLNALSTILLIAGYLAIRNKNRKRHQRCMTAALTSSGLFLTVYLYNHGLHGSTPYPLKEDWTYKVYLAVLLPHILLAVLMVPFILRGYWLARREFWARHARLMRIVWPVWVYVSATGVLVFWMLYVLPGIRT
jgi:putative membrane protein